MKSKNKCVIFIVEGETEEEFFKALVQFIRNNKPLQTSVKYINMQGYGGFKNTALRKFINDIKPQFSKDCKFTIILCYDNDVFQFNPNPPINWSKLSEQLKKRGADKVIKIIAHQTIEDWFLLDIENIISYLRLPKDTKVSGANGVEKLQKLFKLANKTYIKGKKTSGLISQLDINKIATELKDTLTPIYKIIK